ncbi:MAG: PepSY domain-containing protein, partial [Anaerolineae bacterium]|nr:PepSY domain-containing protein [Anaerolineae bacterium]
MRKKLMLMTGLTLLVVGLLSTGLVAFAQGPTPNEGDLDGPNDQTPTYTCSIHVPEDQNNLAGLATITTDQARAAALAANPGTTATKVELDNENGCLVYAVELSNGKDVKVDAGNAHVVHTEAAGSDDGSEGGEGGEGGEG